MDYPLGVTAEKQLAADAEAVMREAVEASYRPRVSEVYGVHVPLGERAARLQCLAVVSLVGGGEDDEAMGGGSGSGGESCLWMLVLFVVVCCLLLVIAVCW